MRVKKLLLGLLGAAAIAGVIAVGIVAHALQAGGSHRGVTFIVKNVGKEPIPPAVVHVTGNAYAIGDLAPGASKWVVLHPAADSHVELAIPGRPRMNVGCYMSHGYGGAIAAEITAEKAVAVTCATVFGW